MKNKHLVLIFLATLGVGLLARRLPLPFRRVEPVDLLRIDTARVTSIVVTAPDGLPLRFERTDRGWSATQAVRTVALQPAALLPMLAALQQLDCIPAEPPAGLDTAAAAPKRGLRVAVEAADGRQEVFWLGRPFAQQGQAHTYLLPEQHTGFYSVAGALFPVFNRSLDDFRPGAQVVFRPASVTGIALSWRDHPPLYLLRHDSAGVWQSADGRFAQPDSVVQRWLQRMRGLDASAHADYFDESRSGESYLTRVTLERAGLAGDAEPLVLRIFYLPVPEAPDDVALLRRDKQYLAPYVLATSAQPGFYFAVADSLLAREVCFGLLPGKEGN